MTDNLRLKFGDMASLLTTQHAEIIEQLAALALAVGAAPPTATVTLADVVGAISTTNARLLTIQNSSANIYSKLSELAVTTDHLIDNQATNTRLLISTLTALACPCATTLPTLAPPLDIEDTFGDDIAKCQRIQFYLDLMTHWFRDIAVFVAGGGFVTGGVLRALLADEAAQFGLIAIAEGVGVAVALPEIVVAAVVGIILSAVATFGALFFTSYVDTFESEDTQSALREALFNVSNAADGSNVYYTVVYNKLGLVGANIIWQLSYTQWFNEMYGAAPIIDATRYDGTRCGAVVNPTTGCITLHSVVATFANDNPVFHPSFSCIVWPSSEFSVSSSVAYGSLSADQPVFCNTQLLNWVVNTSQSGLQIGCNGYWGPGAILAGGYTIRDDTAGKGMYIRSDDTNPFSIEICPPLS